MKPYGKHCPQTTLVRHKTARRVCPNLRGFYRIKSLLPAVRRRKQGSFQRFTEESPL